MRFINDDMGLKHNDRIVPYDNSKFSVIMKIEEEASKCGYSGTSFTNFDGTINPAAATKMIRRLFENHEQINADNCFGLKAENCIFDARNIPGSNIGDNLLGMHVMDHGLSYFGAIVGGDGDKGAFVIFYKENNDLRMFIPILGNKVNALRMCPISNDSHSERFLSYYNMTPASTFFNWNAIKIDILANITVDYQSVIDSHTKTFKK